MRARFRVLGRLDRASALTEGTVTIERETGIITVRPLRKRRTYSLTLGEVATWICQTIIRAEVAEKRARKRARRTR